MTPRKKAAKKKDSLEVTPQRRTILGWLADDEEVIFYEPNDLDVAIVGLTQPQSGREGRQVVYDMSLLIQAFQDQGMTAEEAGEWIDFNVLGGWLGEATPIVIDLLPKPAKGDVS